LIKPPRTMTNAASKAMRGVGRGFKAVGRGFKRCITACGGRGRKQQDMQGFTKEPRLMQHDTHRWPEHHAAGVPFGQGALREHNPFLEEDYGQRRPPKPAPRRQQQQQKAAIPFGQGALTKEH
jgi:hypothetical protein